MLITFYDSYTILNKVYSDGAFLKQAMADVVIDEKNRPMVTKICYGVLDKDIALSYYLSLLCDKKPKLAIRTVLKIALYCVFYLNKPIYAVTDTAVELCNKLGKKGVSGFVNAILRKSAKLDRNIDCNTVDGMSIFYDYPGFVVSELVSTYGDELAREIMSAPNERTCIRFSENTDGEEYLKALNMCFDKTPYKNAYFVDRFVRNSDYDLGKYTFQSIGSIAICDAVEACDNVLDACAAPGGKSILLSQKCKNVVAQELHPHRVNLITEYANRMGVDNVKSIHGDATVFNYSFEGKFDAVLCDVPCSGFGVLKENPDIKLNKDKENIIELVKIQENILQNCSRYVKRGGALLYSTCSILGQECEGVVKSFLKGNDGFTVDVISPKIPYYKKEFGIQFLPHISYGAGFYLCALRRMK